VGGWVKDERASLLDDAPPPFGEGIAATRDLEGQVLGAEGLEGLVLRYGFFYGPRGTYTTSGYWAEEFRKRRFPIVGNGEGMTSFVQIEDAAASTVAAVERGEAGIYNVCDDEPARGREWIPAYAAAVGAKRPFRVPKWIARLIAGKALAAMATSTRGASNEKAKRELGWQPRYPSWRQGFREALG
jgi:2-alkyl-3-oxoalkanoate reductase